MAFGKRPDGTKIKGLSGFRKMLPYLMTSRTESTIYFEQQLDVTETLKYLEEINSGLDKKNRKLTFFQIFLAGIVRTVALRPQLNRFLSGYKYYQRNSISLNFVAKKELNDHSEEINVKIPFAADENLESIAAKVKKHINKGKSESGNKNQSDTEFLGHLPRPILKVILKAVKWLDYHNLLSSKMIKADPFYSTCFVSNLGSVGVDSPYHHNFEWGNCGLFICIGKFRKEAVLDENGQLRERDMLKVTYTLDDRLSEGIYCARAIDLLKDFVENPRKLEERPELSEKLLKELKLSEKAKESIYV